VYEKAGTTLMVTFLNTQAGPTKDLRVRQALHHLWNQEAFNAIVGHTANAGPLYPPLLGRDWKMENPYPYNPARAKQLLAEAGYPNGGFQLRYQSQKGDVDKRAMFEIFQAELAKLNVTVELLDDTWPALVKRATDWGRDPRRGHRRAHVRLLPADVHPHALRLPVPDVPLRGVPDEGRPELHLLLEPRVRPAHQRLGGVARCPARAAPAPSGRGAGSGRTRRSWSTGASWTRSSRART
jgi:hypothetical protein